MQEIDDSYDYGTILGIARRIIRQLILAALFPWLRSRPAEKRRFRAPKIAKLLKVNAYICSGFVQWAYYTTVVRAISGGTIDATKLEDVAFNPELENSGDEDSLLSTTPADIANSDRLGWKYIIKNGVVWEIADDKDVPAILAGRY